MLLSGEDYKTYLRLFNKASRNQDDWNVINSLLLKSDLVYAITEGPDGKMDQNNTTIVSVDNYVPVYTSMEDAKKGFKEIEAELKRQYKSIKLKTGSFVDLARWVDKAGFTLIIDPNRGGRSITYTKRRIELCLMLPWKI